MPADSDMTIAGCGRCRVRPAEASGLCTTCETVLSLPADTPMVLVPRSWLESFDRKANPNEAIADNGGSVWDFFCHEAERFLSASPVGEGLGASASPEHGPRCWGRTSYSEEVAHCYCQKATVTLISREYSEELCNRLRLLSARVDGTTHLNGELVRFSTVFERAIAQLERFTEPSPSAPAALAEQEHGQ